MSTAPDSQSVPLWKRKLIDVFGLDPRSLALLRISLGALLLVDLAIRATDFRAMYSETGFFPLELATSHYNNWNWSLHFLNGADWFQAMLFVIAAVFALAVLVGYRTQLAIFASFVLLCSLHNRNPLILNSGDGFLAMLLFWSIFLPLGRFWSLDARRRSFTYEHNTRPVVSMATAGIIVQICLVYWFTGEAKCNEMWLGNVAKWWAGGLAWSEVTIGGDALYYVCTLDIYGRPLARELINYPTLLQWIALSTVVLELLGPLLLFSPFFTKPLRILLFAAFVGFHIGIELTITVGLFSFVSIAAWSVLLPDSLWNSRPIQFVQRVFGRVVRHLQKKPALRGVDPSPSSRNKFVVAGRWAVNAVAAAFLLYIIAWNVSYLDESGTGLNFRRSTRLFANTTMVRQHWQMFGRPPNKDNWFVYKATLSSSDEVDVFRGGVAVNLEEPQHSSAVFPNHRWRKLHRHILDERMGGKKKVERYRSSIAEYFCREWNASHGADEQIVLMEVYCFEQPLGPRAPQVEPKRIVLATVRLDDAAGSGDYAQTQHKPVESPKTASATN